MIECCPAHVLNMGVKAQTASSVTPKRLTLSAKQTFAPAALMVLSDERLFARPAVERRIASDLSGLEANPFCANQSCKAAQLQRSSRYLDNIPIIQIPR